MSQTVNSAERETVDGEPGPAVEPIGPRRVDKFARRRAELAGAALQTLSELGYARTSLREIAQNSDFSHGVLHYYFADKVDLITEGVRQYKADCVQRYDAVVAGSRTADELRSRFGRAMADTLRRDAPMHQLWYDLRTQSFFEPSFRADVAEIDASLLAMIWRIVSRYCELIERAATVEPPVAYALFDGLFQQALLQRVIGEEEVASRLEGNVRALLASLVAG
ncbi:TetR/AcrR family transcriptional regulator [Jatrophihabitans telluris]|uniref:TetR/AcrR family transcriptional regulator n=1 Tax=Jatrophihabitans telluris TaxID=2038343 RepID=A0ABY4R372_9ACTN|nr:TetR/AcrR family transcriptional regulator [Jatrophihabitans telluris]UQX90244.1 TetR/AcrR family transcriptional regulator [Jatrophihabitans telluris]